MLERVKCPKCGSMKTYVYTTPSKYKIVQIRYRKCNECSTKFITRTIDGVETFVDYVQQMKNRI